jgi:hypothetical protein
MKLSSASVVIRPDVPVVFLRTRDVAEETRRAWARLEELVGTRGRKFYGALDPPTGEYWVCVQAKKGDDPAELGLEAGTLPGGRYLRARLRGEQTEIYERIAPTFNALETLVNLDPTRPEIEFYRAGDEIDVLVPILE